MKLFRSENTTLLANRVTGSNKLEVFISDIRRKHTLQTFKGFT